jgi:hypothetical protein
MKTGDSSIVGLLAVDQSVLLLKTGNDIEEENVFKALNNFDPRNYTVKSDKYGIYYLSIR